MIHAGAGHTAPVSPWQGATQPGHWPKHAAPKWSDLPEFIDPNPSLPCGSQPQKCEKGPVQNIKNICSVSSVVPNPTLLPPYYSDGDANQTHLSWSRFLFQKKAAPVGIKYGHWHGVVNKSLETFATQLLPSLLKYPETNITTVAPGSYSRENTSCKKRKKRSKNQQKTPPNPQTAKSFPGCAGLEISMLPPQPWESEELCPGKNSHQQVPEVPELILLGLAGSA